MNRLCLLFLIFLPGCAALQQVAEYGDEIISGGQTATDIGAATSMFNPAIGLWVLTIGGLAVAAGKMLNLFKEK